MHQGHLADPASPASRGAMMIVYTLLERLLAELRGQQPEGVRLDVAISDNFTALGSWRR